MAKGANLLLLSRGIRASRKEFRDDEHKVPSVCPHRADASMRELLDH